MDKYNYLTQQLDLIVGFLEVSDEEIFNKIKGHDRFNLGITISNLYNHDYKNFSNHICSSAFLLGFTHFEDFITKMICELLTNNPSDINHKITYKVINENENNLLGFLADEQSRKLIFTEKMNYLKKRIPNLSDNDIQVIGLANDTRNCIMHNNGFADKRLIKTYKLGEKIILSTHDVNGLGLTARKLAYDVWNWVENQKSIKSKSSSSIKNKK